VVNGRLGGRKVRLRVEVADESGQTLEPPDVVAFEVPSDADGEVAIMIPLGVELTLVLPGQYTLRLYADDLVIAQTRFTVAQPAVAASPNT